MGRGSCCSSNFAKGRRVTTLPTKWLMHPFERTMDVVKPNGLCDLIERRCPVCGLVRISRMDFATHTVRAEWWRFGVRIVAERIPSCWREVGTAMVVPPPIYAPAADGQCDRFPAIKQTRGAAA